jgi:hypothetical protein
MKKAFTTETLIKMKNEEHDTRGKLMADID